MKNPGRVVRDGFLEKIAELRCGKISAETMPMNRGCRHATRRWRTDGGFFALFFARIRGSSRKREDSCPLFLLLVPIGAHAFFAFVFVYLCFAFFSATGHLEYLR